MSESNVVLISRGEAPRCNDCGRRFTSPQQYYRYGLEAQKVICKRVCFKYVTDVLGIRHKVPMAV